MSANVTDHAESISNVIRARWLARAQRTQLVRPLLTAADPNSRVSR